MIFVRDRKTSNIYTYRDRISIDELQLQCNEIENFQSDTSINDSLEGISEIQFTKDSKNLYMTCVDIESNKIIHKKRTKKYVITTESEES